MDISKHVPAWIRTLTPYQPGKPIEELEREYGIHDSIKIASNENPLGPSPRALAALTAALPNLHRYPDGDAFYLKRRLAEKLGITSARVQGMMREYGTQSNSECFRAISVGSQLYKRYSKLALDQLRRFES